MLPVNALALPHQRLENLETCLAELKVPPQPTLFIPHGASVSSRADTPTFPRSTIPVPRRGGETTYSAHECCRACFSCHPGGDELTPSPLIREIRGKFAWSGEYPPGSPVLERTPSGGKGERDHGAEVVRPNTPPVTDQSPQPNLRRCEALASSKAPTSILQDNNWESRLAVCNGGGGLEVLGFEACLRFLDTAVVVASVHICCGQQSP